MYDDGGISGGTLDRPALKRLLADIARGAVDTVVVYKVDRLTRSLALDLIELGEERETDDGVVFGVSAAGRFFPIGQTDTGGRQ